MLKVLSPRNVVIGNVLMSFLEKNLAFGRITSRKNTSTLATTILLTKLKTDLACASFNFVSNIVAGNVLVFFLEVILLNAIFILPYNVLKCLFLC